MRAGSDRLRFSVGVEGKVDMPLHALLDIPVRFTVADKADSCRFAHLQFGLVIENTST